MTQVYNQWDYDPEPFIETGAAGATSIALIRPLTVYYANGSSDTIPAGTVAVLSDGVTYTFDRSLAVYIIYTVPGSGLLYAVLESQVAGLTGDYAPILTVLRHGIEPYQPMQPSGAAIRAGAWSGGAFIGVGRGWQGGASAAGLGWHANAGAEVGVGASVTETGIYLLVPAAPASDMTIFDWDLGSTGYFRCKLTSALHLVLESFVQGTASSVDSAVIVATGGWYWVSTINRSFHGTSGWFPSIQVWAPGGATPGPQGGAQTGFVPGDGHAFDTTGTFAVGVSLTSSYLNFPNTVGWGCSKALVIRDFFVGAEAPAGHIAPPSSDPSSGDALYLARQAVGAAATLLDTSGNGHTMNAGPSGLTIAAVGPYL